MVRKKSILKDAIREIKLTKKRFISLLLIITIGVGFYVGLKSTGEDMRNTAKEYYKETNLMDLKIASEVGFDESNKIIIKSINGIKGLSMVKTLDALTEVNGNDYVIKLNSISKERSKKSEDYINRLTLTSGRYPSTINEGLVEESFLKDNKLSLNDLITLSPENTDDLRAKKIKIVGTVKSSYYSSNDKGTSTIGNGKIDYYMYLQENEFGFDYYNEGFITIDGANNLNTYGEEYENNVNKYKDTVKKTIIKSVTEKNEKSINENQENVKSIESSLNNLYSSDIPQESLTDEIKELSDDLKVAKTNLEKIKNASVYVQTRNELSSFYEYKSETERMDNISKVFPLMFFLVAALVALTSMTRIVEEERVQMGTLQAIGYSKFDVVFKYLLYAILASLGGSIIGSLLFYKWIPMLVGVCYGSFYDMPSIIATFQIKHVLFASLFALSSTVLASLFVFIKDTLETPAMLMRPKSPKPGKKVFLERITKIWNKLNFSNKVTMRNIFRYKKRLLMTVIGICGSTALLLAGFGIRDSIKGIVSNQYGKINKYDMKISVGNLNNIDDLTTKIENNKNVKSSTKINQTMIAIKGKNKSSITSYLIIPSNKEKINSFIALNGVNGNKNLKIKNDGVIISEKLSKLLNVGKKDKIKVTLNNGKELSVTVSEITKNYIEHYVYMSPTLYEKLTSESVSYNVILANNKKISNKNEKILQNEIGNIDGISMVSLSSELKSTYKNMMSTLSYVTIILIISAALLAFVVLYNLSSVNISERLRELATIKVLGFYDEEVTNYVHKETVILTIMGSILGLIFGSILTYYVIKVAETDLFMFSFNISPISYILAFVITIIFLFIVNVFMHYELKKLDMTSSLKSVE